jgi:predicted small metal-binding protein
MKVLKCTDVSGQNCPFEAHGESIEEIKGLMAQHGGEAHPDMTENASEEDKQVMMEKMDSMVRDIE